jgi:hypothetical protein
LNLWGILELTVHMCPKLQQESWVSKLFILWMQVAP